MDFEKLPSKEWERYPFPLAWGQGIPNQERRFYTHDKYIYKLWSSRYSTKDLYISDGKYLGWDYADRPKSVASIDIGFISENVSPAFVDLIWKEGVCVGYVMVKGNNVKEIPNMFYNTVVDRSLSTGFFYADFCAKNTCEIDGVYSLIDLDTPLTKLATINREFEIKNGVLREHVDERYRRVVLEMLGER